MFGFVRIAKFGAVAATALMLLTMPSGSQAAIGRVHAKVLKAGFIVGAGGGSGTLTFKGRRYPLKFGGLSVGTIGVAGWSWSALPQTCRPRRTLLAAIPRLARESP